MCSILRLAACLTLLGLAATASENGAAVCQPGAGEDTKGFALCQDQQSNPTLSMLQLASWAAARESDEGSLSGMKSDSIATSSGTIFDPENSSTQATISSPIPTTTHYANARIYSFQFPVAKYVEELTAAEACFGPEPYANTSQNIHLKPGALAELRVLQLPNAPIGWSGPAGESDRVNVPHTFLTVRLPVRMNDQEAYQSSYALTDDDIAMKIYRFGSGVPAKLANLTVPSVLPGSFAGERRGFTMLEIPHATDAGEASATEVAEVKQLLESSEINYGTEEAHSMPGGIEADFKRINTEATIHSVRKVVADSILLHDGRFEGFGWMFDQPTAPILGYVAEVDLAVTTSIITLMTEKHGPVQDEESVRNPEDASGADFEGIDLNPRENKFRFARTFGEFKNPPNEHVPEVYTRPYMNGDLTWFQIKVNAEKAQKYLPPGATLAPGEPGVFWNTRWQPARPLGSYEPPILFYYSEFWVCLPIIYKEQRYIFPVMLLVDEEFLLMSGADHGFPKKLANITYTFSDGRNKGSEVHLDVDRRGRKLFSLRGKLGNETSEQIPAVNDNGENPDAADYIFVISHQFPWSPAVDRPRQSMAHEIADSRDQKTLEILDATLHSHVEEPMLDFFEGEILRGGFVNIDQDFGRSSKTKISWMMEEPDPKAFVQWWKNSFPVLFM